MDKSKLGTRAKQFQAVTDVQLPRDGYNILQLDGNAFHTFTRGMERPFDDRFIDAMNQVALNLVENIPTARFGFVQSDEISILLKRTHDREEAFFNNRVLKIVSVSAGRASGLMSRLYPEKQPAIFDARFFNVPDKQAVAEFFIWRQRDCTKNSIQSVAQAFYSPKQLHGLNSLQLREKLALDGHAWEDYDAKYRHGRLIQKVYGTREVSFVHKRTQQRETIQVEGYAWKAVGIDRFEDNRALDTLIPEFEVSESRN